MVFPPDSGRRIALIGVPLVSVLLLAYLVLVNVGEYVDTGLNFTTTGMDRQYVVAEAPACPLAPAECSTWIGSGDTLVSIGDRTVGELRADRRLDPYDGVEPGGILEVQYLKGGETQEARWAVGASPLLQRFEQIAAGILSFGFWVVGLVVWIAARPRAPPVTLLALLCLIFGPWYAAGTAGHYVSIGSLVVHAFTWLLALVLVHLHAVAPTKLVSSWNRAWMTGYAVVGVMMALEIAQVMPSGVFYLVFLAGVAVSAALLLMRVLRRPPNRTALAMLAAAAISLGPGVVLMVLPTVFGDIVPRPVVNFSEFAFPFLPMSYAFLLTRRRLGNLEFRANRVLSAYGFSFIYGMAFVAAWLLIGPSEGNVEESLVRGLAALLVFVLPAPVAHRWFQRGFDRLAYGVTLDPDALIHDVSTRIAAASSPSEVVGILDRDVLSSLLVLRGAVYGATGDGRGRLFGNSGGQTPEEIDLDAVVPSGSHRRCWEGLGPDELSWVRLAIPLRTGNRTVGLWLLGERDPDGFFRKGDIEVLVTIAGYAATAIENTSLFRELRQRRSELEETSALLKRRVEEKRSAVEALRNVSRRSDALLAAIPDIVVERDTHGVYVWSNDAGEEFFGSDIVGRRATDFIVRERSPDDFFAPPDGTGPGLEYTERVERRQDGQSRVLAWRSRELLSRGGRVAGYLSTARDITEVLEHSEKLTHAQKMEAVGQLTGGIAHDFNNLLTVITGNIALLDTDDREEHDALVSEIRKAADSGASLVSRLLLVARRKPSMTGPVAVGEAVRNLEEILVRSMGKQVSVSFEVAPDLGYAVVDVADLESAILNLAINARDAMNGQGSLQVRAMNLDVAEGEDPTDRIGPGGYVSIEVEDSGDGIAPELLERVFEPFFTTKEPGKGTGLGLSTINAFVRKAGGEVQIVSEVGSGTTVTMILPRVDG